MTTNDITVVGGFYGEECSYPPRVIYRGSGGRAASTLRGLGASVKLVTSVGPSLKDAAVEIAKQRGFALCAADKATDIWFHYAHPLAAPSISNSGSKSVREIASPIEAEFALVFGMLEGRSPVHARRAVYDPQDGSAAQSFWADGSTAVELALVLSFSEGVALSRATNPNEIVVRLLEGKNVAAVILKCGPQGALVATREAQHWIRAFPTDRVYKVGSGDVFSAAFSYAWLLQKESVLASAWFASRTVAHYVESSDDTLQGIGVEALWQGARAAQDTMTLPAARSVPDTQIYLAGPFFSTAQRWLVDEARAALMDMGFKVFSPVHDVGMGSCDAVVQKDLEALDKSGIVMALADGMDPGTIFEIGYARSKGIPVVIVAESAKETDLTMMFGADCAVLNDFATGIYFTCWKLMGDV